MQRLLAPCAAPAGAVTLGSGRRAPPKPMAQLFGAFSKAKTTKQAAVRKYETVVLKPNYNIPAVLLLGAGAAHLAEVNSVAAVAGVLGAFLAFQAGRVSFVFDDQALEVVIGEKSTENAFVGGQNRWAYSTFVNWEYWWPGFPVLVYFKETQTKPEGQVMAERCGPSQTTKLLAPKQ
eukprot:scaffold2.g7049.t1